MNQLRDDIKLNLIILVGTMVVIPIVLAIIPSFLSSVFQLDKNLSMAIAAVVVFLLVAVALPVFYIFRFKRKKFKK